jgi:hypothetical protein
MKTTNTNKRIACITQKMNGEYFAYDEAAEYIDERVSYQVTRRELIAELKRRAKFDKWDGNYTHYRTPAGRLVKF